MAPSDREVPDRPISVRDRLVLAGLLAALGVVAATCGACAARVGDALAAAPRRSLPEQHGATVKITVDCPGEIPGVPATHFGSGVVVSADRVVTALHVSGCGRGGDGEPSGLDEPLSIKVDPGDGVEREATREILIPSVDVARIQVAGNAPLRRWLTPLAIGPRPALGDQVCEAAAYPRYTYRCGMVQPWRGAKIYAEYFTEFGNSGSGVYSDGRLVGILTTLAWCQGNHPCLAGISPLQGYEWLVP